MDPQVQASFIPKKPLTGERGGRGGFSGLIFLVALLIFITSIVAAGAAFFYRGYLETSLNSKKDSLSKYQAAFDLPTIQALVRFDSRINQAKTVLSNHIAPSGIFYFLSQQTLVNVQLRAFTYALGADGSAKIDVTGVADSFSTVALQSDQFGASKVLKDVIFSDITVETGGKVAFHVTATVDPSLILYSKNLGVTQELSSNTSSNVSTSTASTTKP